MLIRPSVSRVPADTWNPQGSRGDHPPTLNTTWWPIVKQYREGKVKRTPGGEWKRTWNRVLTNCQRTLKSDGVLFVERSGEYFYVARLRYWSIEAKGKPSVKSARSCMKMTRNRVTYPCPGWSGSKISWRSEPTAVEKVGDEVWVAEKFQSNSDIAGSPRNSFRASLMLV